MTEKNTNPLLKKLAKSNRMPGMTFRLPSKGLPYKNGELAEEVENGEILIFPMSTLDEIYLKTPDMLFQGTAVEKVIGRCCPQVQKPLELLAKDVDYILTCMRQVSYGDIIDLTYKCECPKAKEVQLEVKISSFLRKTKLINDDMDSLSLELDGFLVRSKYATFDGMIKLNQENNSLDSPEDVYNAFIDNLTISIEAIDEITDPDVIREFLINTDRGFQMSILDHVQKINDWGMDFEHEFTCKYCGEKKSTTISLNPVSFFSQPSSQANQS